MTDQELISALLRISKMVSKSKIEEELGMPKNSLATILKGNKALPPKHRDKMIAYIIQVNNEPENKERIEKEREGGDNLIFKTLQDVLRGIEDDLIEKVPLGYKPTIPESYDSPGLTRIPDETLTETVEKMKARFADQDVALAYLAELPGKYDALLAENEALKEKLRLYQLKYGPFGVGQCIDVEEAKDRKILNPAADRTKQVVEADRGTPAYFIRNGKWGDERDNESK